MSLSADGIQGELVLAVQVCLQVIIFAAANISIFHIFSLLAL